MVRFELGLLLALGLTACAGAPDPVQPPREAPAAAAPAPLVPSACRDLGTHEGLRWVRPERPLTAADVAALGRIPRLGLLLTSTPEHAARELIPLAERPRLAALDGLEALRIENVPSLDAEDLFWTTWLPRLRRLELFWGSLTARGAQCVGAARALERLTLEGCLLEAPRAIDALVRSPTLRELRLRSRTGLLGDTEESWVDARVLRDLADAGTSIERLALINGGSVDDAALAEVARITTLEELDLDGCSSVTAAGLRSLAPLRERLRVLRLGGDPRTFAHLDTAGFLAIGALTRLEVLELGLTPMPVEAPGWQALAGLSRLRELRMDIVGFGDEEARSLARLRRLEHLSGEAHSLTDRGLALLGSLLELRELTLRDLGMDERARPRLTPRGFAALAGLPHLSSLSLECCELQVSDEMVLALAKRPSLRHLSIETANRVCTPLSDASLRALAKRPLRTLALHGRGITDQGLTAVATIDTLERLSLTSPNLTRAGLQTLTPLRGLRELTLHSKSLGIDLAEPLRAFEHLSELGLFVPQEDWPRLPELHPNQYVVGGGCETCVGR